jgi:hypothetical protein
MAPEVFRGAYGPPADVWAAGVTAYYLLTRRYPWWPTLAEVLTLTPRAVRGAVLNPCVADFASAAAPALGHVSAECVGFIAACLARAPGDRPTAVAALAHPWFRGAGRPAAGRRPMGELSRSIAASAARAATRPAPPSIDDEDEYDVDDGFGAWRGSGTVPAAGPGPSPGPGPTTRHPGAAALAAFVDVLAHKSMSHCETCGFAKCPLSGAAARALDRVDASVGCGDSGGGGNGGGGSGGGASAEASAEGCGLMVIDGDCWVHVRGV